MKTIRNRDYDKFACIRLCSLVYFGFYTRNGVRKYIIESNTPIWLKHLSFYKSKTKPNHLWCWVAICSIATIIAVPIWSIVFYAWQVINIGLYFAFFNVLHNLQRPWWDDRLAGAQSLLVLVYAVVISWLYFSN